MRPISQTFRCFDEVVRRGSIRKAADSLHLTAAAVHQQILNLEEQVGSPLFDRLPRGMQLTTAGEIIIAAVRRGQRDFDNAMTQVEDLRSLRRGHINLAVSPSTAERLVPEAIQAAMKSYPGVTYSVRSGNGESILKWVETGEATSAMACAASRRLASWKCARFPSTSGSSRRRDIHSRSSASGPGCATVSTTRSF